MESPNDLVGWSLIHAGNEVRILLSTAAVKLSSGAIALSTEAGFFTRSSLSDA